MERDMERSKWLKFRVSESELEKVRAYAASKGWTQAQAVREWIKRLPSRNLHSN